jgi:hypothetical protein
MADVYLPGHGDTEEGPWWQRSLVVGVGVGVGGTVEEPSLALPCSSSWTGTKERRSPLYSLVLLPWTRDRETERNLSTRQHRTDFRRGDNVGGEGGRVKRRHGGGGG